MIYCYDCEVYINFFCVTFKEVNTGEVLYFEISEYENNLDSLYKFITLAGLKNKWFIGYNNHYYDNQLLNWFYKTFTEQNKQYRSILDICTEFYELSQNIIQNDLRIYKYNLPFKSLDLMRVGNTYQKSLKLLGCNLQHHKLQDLPLAYNHIVKEYERDLIKHYNLNDIEITEKLYNTLLPQIKLRKEISQMYNVNVMDESDSGISNKLLEKFYSELTGKDFSEFKDLRTPRDLIHFGDVIFKDIRFKSEQLKQFLDKLRSFVLIKNKTYFKKSFIYNGIKISMMSGGLHSVDNPKLFVEDDEYYIIDQDYSSYYPSIMINNNLVSQHLDKRFALEFKKIRDERLEAKHNKQKAKAEALKVCINSYYGKTNFEHHWVYDPLVAYKVTINGQLYLLMMMELLFLNGFEVISLNTDGQTVKVPKNRLKEYLELSSNFSKEYGFETEFVKYKLYCRRDVNNYISQKYEICDDSHVWNSIAEKDQLKAKGEFVIDTPLQKGVDKKIIAIALQEYFINNKSIKDTIMSHTNIYDFCTAIRTDPKFTTEFHYLKDNNLQINIMQKTNRYYISKKGGKLLKWKLDKKNEKQYIDYCVGRQVTIFNNYIEKPMNEYDIDYGYYISETQKIIDLIIPKQLTLF